MVKQKIIAMSAPVSIQAAEGDTEHKGPRTFSSTFYTGGALDIAGYDLPVVVDLAGLKNGNVLVANLDHDKTKRVGNFDVVNDGKQLVANGKATAATPARDEVVNSANDGYQWQASLEVAPSKIEAVKSGKTVTVNGQTFTGPLYVTRQGTLKGFAFVSHGADDNTTATIAASAAHTKGKNMKSEIKAWAEGMGIDVDNASAEQIANIEANYEGRNGAKPAKIVASNPFEARKVEAKRQKDIRDMADKLIEQRGSALDEIEAIEKMVEHAIEAGMEARDFRLELYESTIPMGHTVRASKHQPKFDGKVIEAAICQAGRLPGIEDEYDDRTLQTAHDRFKGRIGLKQLFLICAEANGFRDSTMDVTREVHNAAFGMHRGREIHGGGFSTSDIATILSNTANKFIMRGWNMVDQTPLRIAKIQNVRDFKTITTVSLADSVRYEQVGNDGEIKHGTLSELTYTNKADTYAKMLAITRQDIINDDVGALTDVPMKLGNGAMKLLNHIFWTEFLAGVSGNFFSSGNANINTAVADMTVGGLDATETIFMNQTNPDGTPLGVQPAILLVPTALKNKALTLMGSMLNAAAITSYGAATGDANPFQGRFRVESSPYISNSSYTGYTSTAWWMLANPEELPVIAIAALNGRVEPTVETADAEFNTLGVQMRGYADVGVNLQEYRGGVHADGGSS
jgi:hypothetical protein